MFLLNRYISLVSYNFLQISQTKKVALITGKAKSQVTTEDVPDELLEKTEKKSEEKGSLAAVSESLFLALLPPEAIQLVATGHITDVRAEKALVKAEAKELVMAGLKTAASKVVEDLIAAANEMVGMDTPRDTEISQTKKVALITGKAKSKVTTEDVPDELLEKTEKKSEEKGSMASVTESLSLAILPPEAIQLVATGHMADVRAEKALVKAEAKDLVMDSLNTAACKVVEDLIAAANEMVGMDTPLDTEISQTKKVALITGKAKSQVTTDDVHDELLEKTEKKSEEKASLAAVSKSLSLALLPPEAIQLVATGHIADVRAEKAFMKAEAKELVMDSLKTAASKVVEDLIAAAVEKVHMTTPLDTQTSQTRKVALINGKSEIAAEDVLNELLDKVVKESEKRRSLALISVSDCPLLATQLPQLTDLVPEKCSGEAAKCAADEDRQVKKKKKKGIHAFFRGLWKRMICSSGIPKED
ncbi:uncharacterized protein LOC134032853 [Osmerus eperlanus]|uniref:uncharacterized protein LOC134032853 n=1 Tax=Osmerus eperlanus TaxID=29151 RepID=UPI002E147D8E